MASLRIYIAFLCYMIQESAFYEIYKILLHSNIAFLVPQGKASRTHALVAKHLALYQL